jgi:predicted PurR-regulated permease PerM
MSQKIEMSTRTWVRFWLVTLGFVVAALFIWKALAGLLILGASLFFAIALNPVVRKLDRFLPGKNRKAASALAYVAVVAVVGAILAVVIPAIVGETVKFVGQMPAIIEQTTEKWEAVDNIGKNIGIENLQDQILNGVKGFSESFIDNFGTIVLTSVGAIGGALAAVILILVLTFLMLIEGPEILAAFWRRFGGNTRANRVRRVLDAMANVVEKYVSGQLLVALVDGCMTALAVFVLSLIFGFSPGLALPFGLITGTLCLIPMFGAFIGGALVAMLMAFSNVWAGVAFMAYFIIYLQMEANFISPRIQSKGLKLPALVVLAAVTIGVYMFGLIGAIVAIPVAGCVKVLVDEYRVKS